MAPPVPHVPARTVLKHIQASRNRVHRYGKEAENLRQGLRVLQMDTMDLRVELLSKQGGELAAQQEASLLAAQYAAGAVIGALDTAVRVEVAFQQEMTRWIRGLPPSTRVERIAEASGASNGRHQVPAIESVQAEAHEVVSPQPVVQGQEFATREEAAAAIEAKIAADTNGAPTPS